VKPVLFKQYVETGQVTFVYKHMAILGTESTWAAEASECAADQGKFWEYHDLVFSRQAGENQGAFTKDKLLGMAQELKLDMTKFEPCLRMTRRLAGYRLIRKQVKRLACAAPPPSLSTGKR